MSRSILRAGLFSMTTAVLVLCTGAAEAQELLGFSPEGARAQRALEAGFDEHLDAGNLRSWLERLSSHPNHVGSAGAKENAEWIADQFRAWGFETRIDVYQVLFPTPKERLVELVAPTRYRLRLEEPTLAEDATSGVIDDRLPTYNAFSADGDVEGEVVYVNYGIPADYEELERRGIDVRGKIALARYGGSWRGIKPKSGGATRCHRVSDLLGPAR